MKRLFAKMKRRNNLAKRRLISHETAFHASLLSEQGIYFFVVVLFLVVGGVAIRVFTCSSLSSVGLYSFGIL